MADLIRPTVLVVDDNADDERAKLRGWESSLHLIVRHPQDVEESDLTAADLVVVDYILDHWPARDSIGTISLRPPNGIALTATLRGHAFKLDGSPAAFLLRSAHLQELSDGFPPETRLHVIAQQHNVEWVQAKDADLVNDQSQQIQSLAAAVKALPENWPCDDAGATRQIIEKWLAIPDLRWKSLAWQDIEDCHPPFHELTKRRHGLRFVRWFLHRILPYPCFLWTTGRLAARLRVTHDSLVHSMACGLATVFQPAKYAGQLHDFLGYRWWGSGCEAVLWDITDGNSFDLDLTVATLNDRCSGTLQRSGFAQPVLLVDANYGLTDTVCEVEQAVRVQPDDWPAYAENAWARLDDVLANDRLRASVIASDRERLVEGPEEEGQ